MAAGTAGADADRRWMRRALALARRGEGRVAPNPMVGAVLVRGGRLLAEGAHRLFGGPHAEAAALAAAGGQARGATLYTTLEPCCHHGKTPPCAQAVVAARVRRVVSAVRDPDPRVRGRGLALMRRAGLEVESGLLEREARFLNEAYFTRVARGRPLVILKLAASLDGRIAGRSGDSRWITSPAARARGRRWRERVDAVLVGGGTAGTDDPLLTARGQGRAGRRQPLRVVVAGRRLPAPGSRLLRAPAGGPVVVYVALHTEKRGRALERAGAEVVGVAAVGGLPSPAAVLEDLAGRGISSVLVEGGGLMAWSLLEDGLVDRLVWYAAPLVLGGGAIPAVAGPGAARPAAGLVLEEMACRAVGPDLEITARPRRRC